MTLFFRITLLGAAAVTLLAPAGLRAQTLGGSPVAPRDQAQALRDGTIGMYNKKLTPKELELRNDVIVLRDSLDVAEGFAYRLERASAANMLSVAASALKELKPACAAAARTSASIHPRVQALEIRATDRTKQDRVSSILKNYKTSYAKVSALMTTCGQQVTSLMAASALDVRKATELAQAIQAGILAHESMTRGMLTEYGIPLMPKQQSEALKGR